MEQFQVNKDGLPPTRTIGKLFTYSPFLHSLDSILTGLSDLGFTVNTLIVQYFHSASSTKDYSKECYF